MACNLAVPDVIIAVRIRQRNASAYRQWEVQAMAKGTVKEERFGY